MSWHRSSSGSMPFRLQYTTATRGLLPTSPSKVTLCTTTPALYTMSLALSTRISALVSTVPSLMSIHSSVKPPAPASKCIELTPFQIYLPVTYALNTFGLSFATISSLLIWLYLERRHSIIAIFQASSLSSLFKRGPIPSWNLQPAYKTVPAWWYVVSMLLSLGLGLSSCEYYPVQLRWHGVLLALVICAVFFVAVSSLQKTERVP